MVVICSFLKLLRGQLPLLAPSKLRLWSPFIKINSSRIIIKLHVTVKNQRVFFSYFSSLLLTSPKVGETLLDRLAGLGARVGITLTSDEPPYRGSGVKQSRLRAVLTAVGATKMRQV